MACGGRRNCQAEFVIGGKSLMKIIFSQKDRISSDKFTYTMQALFYNHLTINDCKLRFAGTSLVHAAGNFVQVVTTNK